MECSDGLPVQFSNSLAMVTFDAARENRHVHPPATHLSWKISMWRCCCPPSLPSPRVSLQSTFIVIAVCYLQRERFWSNSIWFFIVLFSQIYNKSDAKWASNDWTFASMSHCWLFWSFKVWIFDYGDKCYCSVTWLWSRSLRMTLRCLKTFFAGKNWFPISMISLEIESFT